MEAQPSGLLARMFCEVDPQDPRADNARHRLTDILVIAILGVMCGCDDYPGIVSLVNRVYPGTIIPVMHMLVLFVIGLEMIGRNFHRFSSPNLV